MSTYKKTTLDYLIKVIRAIKKGDYFRFCTAAYEGGLNFYIQFVKFLNEQYVAVVAPSISEKAFLIYGPDIERTIWEDGFKDFLMTLDPEVGLDPDGYPCIAADKLDRFLALHPETAPSEDEVWDLDEKDGDKTVSSRGWSLVRNYYQPVREDPEKAGEFELPEGMISFFVLASEKSCEQFVESIGQDKDAFVPMKMLPGDVQGPTLLYADCRKWCAAPMHTLKVVSASAFGSEEKFVLFPDLEGKETQKLLDDAKAALDSIKTFGHIQSIESIPEENLTKNDLEAIKGYILPTRLLG